MKLKFTATIEVDVEKLKESAAYPEVDNKDVKFLRELILHEFEWVRRSGIAIKKLKVIK